jgi:tRNA(fMet)-specific endonuclease VapC
MPGRYLLDTNIVIALFNGDPGVKARLQASPEIFLSSVVLGELYFGAIKSSRTEANRARIEDFAAFCPLVVTDGGTALEYGIVKTALKRKGKPIPENDVWIAACALQHDLILVSRDGHFEYVEGLRFEAW